MFENILVPLDGSPMADRILLHVAAIAQRNGRRWQALRQPSAITLLRVLETDGVRVDGSRFVGLALRQG